MRRLLLAAFLVTVSTAALAQDTRPDTRYDTATVSGDVTGVSDYRHRGISRSDEGPALQGKLQLNSNIGLYGGLKGSTVDFGDADVEAVLFGGYKMDFDGVDVKTELNYSTYPGDDGDDLDYAEFIASFGYDFDVFYGALTWGISPEYINESGMSLYYGADVAVPLEYGLTATANLGFMFIDDEARYAEDYAHWGLGIWYNWAEWDVDLGLEYVDTNIDDDECMDNCGATAVFTAKKPFGF
mgnify:CR=1 FL=1